MDDTALSLQSQWALRFLELHELVLEVHVSYCCAMFQLRSLDSLPDILQPLLAAFHTSQHLLLTLTIIQTLNLSTSILQILFRQSQVLAKLMLVCTLVGRKEGQSKVR